MKTNRKHAGKKMKKINENFKEITIPLTISEKDFEIRLEPLPPTDEHATLGVAIKFNTNINLYNAKLIADENLVILIKKSVAAKCFNAFRDLDGKPFQKMNRGGAGGF